MLGFMSTTFTPTGGQDTIRTRLWWPGVAVVAVIAFAAEMAVSARYGYMSDELYFLAAGHHPASAYVAQPPLTPLLAAGWSFLTGDTLAGFRVLPALALVVMVVATAAMAT